MIPYLPASPAPRPPAPEISSDIDPDDARAFADAVSQALRRMSPEARRCADAARDLGTALAGLGDAMQAYRCAMQRAEILAWVHRTCAGNRRRQMRRRNQRA